MREDDQTPPLGASGANATQPPTERERQQASEMESSIMAVGVDIHDMPVVLETIKLEAAHVFPDCLYFELKMDKLDTGDYYLKSGFSFSTQRYKIEISPKTLEERPYLPRLLEFLGLKHKTNGAKDGAGEWLVEFGLRGGSLKFEMEGLCSPLTDRQFLGKFETEIQAKRVFTSEADQRENVKESFDIGAQASATNFGVSAKTQMETMQNSSAAHSDKIEIEETVACVHACGEAEAPTWSFRPMRNHDILYGGQPEIGLAKLTRESSVQSVHCHFKVFTEDFCISKSQPLHDDELTPKQFKACKLRLMRELYRHSKGRLMSMEWCNDRP